MGVGQKRDFTRARPIERSNGAYFRIRVALDDTVEAFGKLAERCAHGYPVYGTSDLFWTKQIVIQNVQIGRAL
jgi:hypothetical protein